jgi:hypothetical protein
MYTTRVCHGRRQDTGRNDEENPLRDSEAFGTGLWLFTPLLRGKLLFPHICYAFRGSELTCLSLYKYASLNIVSEKRKASESSAAENELDPVIPTEDTHSAPTADLAGHQANTTFAFSVGHLLRGMTHVQKFRSKSFVGVPVAYPPQPPPGKQAILTYAWKQQARKFARCVFSLFRPWTSNGGQSPGNLRWYAYSKLMRDLALGVEGTGQPHLGRVRHAWITNIAH